MDRQEIDDAFDEEIKRSRPAVALSYTLLKDDMEVFQSHLKKAIKYEKREEEKEMLCYYLGQVHKFIEPLDDLLKIKPPEMGDEDISKLPGQKNYIAPTIEELSSPYYRPPSATDADISDNFKSLAGQALLYARNAIDLIEKSNPNPSWKVTILKEELDASYKKAFYAFVGEKDDIGTSRN